MQISSKGNTRRAGPVRQISVKEMIRKLEENPGNSQNFKTDRKPQTPRKSQTGNKVKEFKRLPQQASPGKITRWGGSIKKIQKIGSPMLPYRKTFKKQKANLISSNMGRGLFAIFQTKSIPSTERVQSQKCDGPMGWPGEDTQGNNRNSIGSHKSWERKTFEPAQTAIASTSTS